jgi:lipoprotein NlpD
MRSLLKQSIALTSLILVACSSTPNRAPVIDRSPEPPKAKVTQAPKKVSTKSITNGKDWRPETYTVKKGDTLYSLGLEFGYDYKEIAQNNNISAPYNIRVGQQLKIKNNSTANNKPIEANNDDVVIKPLNNDSQITQTQNTNVSPTDIPSLNSPKAIRESYTEQAASNNTSPAKNAETKVPEIKPAEAKPTDSVITGEDLIDWGLPTKGKIKTAFNEGASAKGVDIEGAMGQDINAAGNGKVIYNGSDLRGYGNLVIVKHNKDYLSVYAHNSKILVKEGQTVVKGQKIAEMGNSGTDAIKLHFEIRYQGKSIDPTKFLTGL